MSLTLYAQGPKLGPRRCPWQVLFPFWLMATLAGGGRKWAPRLRRSHTPSSPTTQIKAAGPKAEMEIAEGNIWETHIAVAPNILRAIAWALVAIS